MTPADTLRYFQIVTSLAGKISDVTAGNTLKMMMAVQNGIETTRSSLRVDDFGEADFRERQERSVDRVVRDVRMLLSDGPVYVLGGGVSFKADEVFVDGASLGGDLQAGFPAELDEPPPSLRRFLEMHIDIK